MRRTSGLLNTSANARWPAAGRWAGAVALVVALAKPCQAQFTSGHWTNANSMQTIASADPGMAGYASASFPDPVFSADRVTFSSLASASAYSVGPTNNPWVEEAAYGQAPNQTLTASYSIGVQGPGFVVITGSSAASSSASGDIMAPFATRGHAEAFGTILYGATRHEWGTYADVSTWQFPQAYSDTQTYVIPIAAGQSYLELDNFTHATAQAYHWDSDGYPAYAYATAAVGWDVEFVAAPEPASLLLLAGGAVGLVAGGSRRKRALRR